MTRDRSRDLPTNTQRLDHYASPGPDFYEGTLK